MNNKIIIGIIIVIILIVGGVYYMKKGSYSQMQDMPVQTQNSQQSSAPATAGKNAVTIQNFSFAPATLTVKVGENVTWTNQDSVGHSATADDNSFDTGVFAQGQSKSIAFSKAGTYTYHCSVHPNMKATIVVK